MNFVNETAVRRWIKEEDMRYSEGLKERINEEVQRVLSNARDRAEANHRSTIMSKDV